MTEKLPRKIPDWLENRGATQEEYDALLKTRELLADGCLTHRNTFSVPDDPKKPGFNMDTTCDVVTDHSCGTVACIGGWMSLHMNGGTDRMAEGMSPTKKQENDSDQYVAHGGCGRAFYDLFFPGYELDYSSITQKQAVQAIDNFIMNRGDPGWMSIVKRRRKW